MITPGDCDYRETKLIKQGKKVMPEIFKELAHWIEKQFNVSVLNIYYDLIEFNNKPRLNIICEYSRDEEKFKEGWAYDADKQKIIADKFREILKQKDTGSNKCLTSVSNENLSEKYDTKDIWVIFNSFERIAKQEINESIPQEELMGLKQKINNKNLWEISRCFSGTTFFFYTDEQVKEIDKNGMAEYLTDEYFKLLKIYDEFDYFRREDYSVYFDSKENFDNNYQSNWYYYYK